MSDSIPLPLPRLWLHQPGQMSLWCRAHLRSGLGGGL